MDLTLKESTWLSLSVKERRDKLLELQTVSQNLPKEQHLTLEPIHHYCDGIYARELFIPKGTTLVGAIHLKDQINVVSQGKIRVVTEEGMKEIEAPCTFISPAGTKRAGYALEDTVWTVFHPTHSTDQQEIREEFIAEDYEQLDKRLEDKQCHGR